MPEGAGVLAAEPADRVRAILERIVDELDVEASVEVSENAEEIIGRVDGEDLGLLIGRRGQTIDAVQLLCYRAAFRGRPDRKRVTVDAAGRGVGVAAAGYRDRGRDAVERRAARAGERALRPGNEIELEPMTPTERR